MASQHRYNDEEDEPRRPTLLGLLKVPLPQFYRNVKQHQLTPLSEQNILLKPFRLVLSKPALRTYLTTALLLITALLLLAIASTAYTLFYFRYVPRIGFSRDIHLQWDDVYPSGAGGHNSDLFKTRNPFPHGTVSLQNDLVGAQPYDIKLELELPRTRQNREAGNFMLDVSLLASAKSSLLEGLAPSSTSDSAPVLARSRRPAILRYRSLPVEVMHRVSQLPWYLVGVRHESEKLSIDVFESVNFGRGSGSVPVALRLEVQGSIRMQIYSARAVFRARFRGLRWLMYNHRIISAVFFVGVFWSVEMVFAGIAWVGLVAYLGNAFKTEERESMRIKDDANTEDEEQAFLSDTERTFPTLSKQQPLRFRSPEVKKEKKEEDPSVEVSLQDVPPLTGLEADDEDEDGDYFLDSGIGTSMESGGGSREESMRKRRGRNSFRE
jgi:seipin